MRLLAGCSHEKPVPALTSDPVYPATLFANPFSPRRGCLLAYLVGNWFVDFPVTVRPQ